MVIWKQLKFWGLWFASVPLAVFGANDSVGPTHYYFRHLVLASSMTKANAIKLEVGAPPVVIEGLPSLANKEVGDLLGRYIGQEITGQSLARLAAELTAYVKQHGQALIDVSVPPQSAANGEVRVVVVLGAYNLQRLVLGNSLESARDAKVAFDSGQIVLNDVPLLNQQPFAVAVAPFVGHPITEESIEGLIAVIETFVKTQGADVAKVALPPQDIRTGDLRLGLYIGNFPLRRLVIASNPTMLGKIETGAESRRIVAPDIAYFQTPEFDRLMAPYFGRPIDSQLTEHLRSAITAYVVKQDRMVSNIPIPDIDLKNGEVRVVVGVEHYSQLKFKGNRWFSDRLLSRQFGIKAGDEVRVSQLDAAVNQINQNPFRHAQVLVDTVNKDPGVADLDVAVQESTPYRFTFSYDDTGNDTLGDNHYTLSAQAGNLFGLDQQLSLQYTTTDVSHAFHSALLTYRAPLPWNHYISFTGAYTGYRTYAFDGDYHLKGSVYQGDLRYVVPIIRDNWSLEYSVGIDYKQQRLFAQLLGFGATEVAADDTQDVAQATSSVTWLEHDQHGSTAVNLNGNFSPGNFNRRNTDAAYDGNLVIDPNTGLPRIDPQTGQPEGGQQAEARYMYGVGFLQRIELLPDDFQLLARTQGQISSARLLGTEELAIGGAATVRGYDERIMSGDEGWTLTTEVRSPAWKQRLTFINAKYAPLETRFLVFYDDGRVDHRHPLPSDTPLHRLSSTGLGLRSNWGSQFSISADYGWQISDTSFYHPNLTGRADPFAQPNHGRFHLQGAISY
jgi:hemolysin activation/secretion protein